jgi:hypothetical protein
MLIPVSDLIFSFPGERLLPGEVVRVQAEEYSFCAKVGCTVQLNLPPIARIWGSASFHIQKSLHDGIFLGKGRLDHCSLYCRSSR